METIILASSSPRRQEYFRLLGLPFTAIPSPAEEILDKTLPPRRAVEEVAIQKVNAVRPLCQELIKPWILGADTIVVLNGNIYGKPRGREDARLMISKFQGRTHEVISALALYNGSTERLNCRSVVSTVSFAPMSNTEIDWYLDSGEWEGVAGSYRVQGLISCFIKSIQGSFSSIVGLPLREFYEMLRDNGYSF